MVPPTFSCGKQTLLDYGRWDTERDRDRWSIYMPDECWAARPLLAVMASAYSFRLCCEASRHGSNFGLKICNRIVSTGTRRIHGDLVCIFDLYEPLIGVTEYELEFNSDAELLGFSDTLVPIVGVYGE